MASLNKVMLIGRLTADPDLRFTNSGVAVANFSVAVDRGYTKQDGSKETDFFKCVAWKKKAEVAGQYLSKGSLVHIEGSLENRKWEKDGERRMTTEVQVFSITFLSKKKEGAAESKPAANSQSEFDHMPVDDFTTDDIPF